MKGTATATRGNGMRDLNFPGGGPERSFGGSPTVISKANASPKMTWIGSGAERGGKAARNPFDFRPYKSTNLYTPEGPAAKSTFTQPGKERAQQTTPTNRRSYTEKYAWMRNQRTFSDKTPAGILRGKQDKVATRQEVMHTVVEKYHTKAKKFGTVDARIGRVVNEKVQPQLQDQQLVIRPGEWQTIVKPKQAQSTQQSRARVYDMPGIRSTEQTRKNQHVSRNERLDLPKKPLAAPYTVENAMKPETMKYILRGQDRRSHNRNLTDADVRALDKTRRQVRLEAMRQSPNRQPGIVSINEARLPHPRPEQTQRIQALRQELRTLPRIDFKTKLTPRELVAGIPKTQAEVRQRIGTVLTELKKIEAVTPLPTKTVNVHPKVQDRAMPNKELVALRKNVHQVLQRQSENKKPDQILRRKLQNRLQRQERLHMYFERAPHIDRNRITAAINGFMARRNMRKGPIHGSEIAGSIPTPHPHDVKSPILLQRAVDKGLLAIQQGLSRAGYINNLEHVRTLIHHWTARFPAPRLTMRPRTEQVPKAYVQWLLDEREDERLQQKRSLSSQRVSQEKVQTAIAA